MKRFKKTILWTVAVVLAVGILGIASLALFFPKEKVKELALQRISATLDRPITVQGISTSFWGGLGLNLEKIQIANPKDFDKQDFLRAKSLDVKVRLWPLLKRQIQIDRLILVDPSIMLKKLADGRNNYDFSGADSLAPPGIREALPEDSRISTAAAVTFDNLTIKNGSVDYIDDSSKLIVAARGVNLSSILKVQSQMIYRASGNVSVDSLNISIEEDFMPAMNVGTSFEATVDLNKGTAIIKASDFTVNGSSFDVKAGIPRLKTMDFINAEISCRKLEIGDLLTLIPDRQRALLSGYTLDGGVTLDAELNYQKLRANPLTYAGSYELSDFQLASNDPPTRLSINSLKGNFTPDRVTAGIDGGMLDENPFGGNLELHLIDNPVIYKSNFAGSVDLSTLNRFLPDAGNPVLSGQLRFQLSVTGPVANPGSMRFSGELVVKDGSYSATTLPEPVESFAVSMKIHPDKIDIQDFAVKFVSSDFSLTGTLHDPFPYFIPGYSDNAPLPELTFELVSHRFDVDRLFPEAVPGEGADPTTIPLDSLPPIFLPAINGDGSGTMDTLIYSKVEFTGINAGIRIRGRKIYFSDVTGKVYSGDVSGEVAVDLSDLENPTYSGAYLASQVEVDDFMTRFAGLGGHLFGKLNMAGSFNATGWDPEPVLQSLTMDGNANFTEARLIGFEILDELASSFNVKLPKEETLRDLATAFRVENGRVAFDAMKFLSSTGDWLVGGSVGFDGSLDYAGSVLLSEKATNDLIAQSGSLAGLAGLFKQKGTDRIRVPFRLDGTYRKPRFSIDLNASDVVRDNLTDQVGDALKNLFKKK
ncbi:MAG: AsmA family protein [Candidatus Zixiibacteriota bacterium]|nr:MAG: AsmA family protein [candidate division Zixibacteria bacterium]